MSYLRFNGCIEHALRYRSTSFIEFGAFSNEVLEHVFRLLCEERGALGSIVISAEEETEKGILDRMARVDVFFGRGKSRKPFFFYVFAESSTFHHFREWKLTGRSVLIEGPIRMPDYDKEMIWFE